jgi:hypothetical protein
MRPGWMIGFFFCFSAQAFAEAPATARSFTAKDLIRESEGKWEIDAYAICTVRMRGHEMDVLWHSHAEIVPSAALSRDFVVAWWAGWEAEIRFRFGLTMDPKAKAPLRAWDCRPVLAPVEGLVTMSAELHMDADGFTDWGVAPDGREGMHKRVLWEEALRTHAWP